MPDTPPISAAELDDDAMMRLAAGEDATLNDLMDRWSHGLISFLTRLTGNHATACDLAQETFVRLYQARERFIPGGTFKPFLFQIATNLARNHARWKSRHPEAPIDCGAFPEPAGPIHTSPSEEAVADETAGAVQAAVLSLPEDLRIPLVLSVYEGLSHKQIAATLACSPKAVEMRIYKARQTLRGRLKDFITG